MLFGGPFTPFVPAPCSPLNQPERVNRLDSRSWPIWDAHCEVLAPEANPFEPAYVLSLCWRSRALPNSMGTDLRAWLPARV